MKSPLIIPGEEITAADVEVELIHPARPPHGRGKPTGKQCYSEAD
jgi:hypothetical protein